MVNYSKIILGAVVICITLFVVKYVFYEIEANKNVDKCLNIEHDMSMSQVVEIIGEPDEIMSNNAKINYKNLEVIIYFYKAPSGSSVGVRIYFDAKTKKVVRIECKD